MIITSVACDLDGTLVDTETAVRRAYEHVGVKNWMPDVPWHRFCTEEQHVQKNNQYYKFLAEYGKVLPLAELAVQNNWEILTGAGLDAINTIKETFPLFKDIDMRWVHHSLVTPLDKARIIKQHGVALYIDDNPDTLAVIRKEFPQCQTLLTVR